MIPKVIDGHFASILGVNVNCIERPSASIDTSDVPKCPPTVTRAWATGNEHPTVGDDALSLMAEVDEKEPYPRDYGPDKREQCCRNGKRDAKRDQVACGLVSHVNNVFAGFEV